MALTRCWAATYTRGLPPDLRAERREEIDCDLWEQHWLASRRGEPALGTAIEVLTRMLLGVFSDITWRLETGASSAKGRTPVNNTLPMRIGFLAAMLPLALLAVMGASFMLGNGDWDNTTEHWIWRSFFMVCPIIGGFGLWLCATRPALGMVLVLAGVASSAFLMPWMAFVTVPIGLVIIAFAIKRSGGAAGTGSGPTAAARSSRWRQLLAVLGFSLATIIGTALYAFSLDEWGAARTLIFNLVAMVAATVAIYATALLLSDLRKRSGRRQPV
ncbi:MAG TPA: hypothetical protein VLS25_08095 [Dehalococcoidia bacterium]|nr:hypothetical protein [Dehalococcoidia bacterium]